MDPALLPADEGARDVLSALAWLSSALLALGIPFFVAELRKLKRGGALTLARMKGMATSAFCLLPATLVEVAFGVAMLSLFLATAALAPLPIAITPLSAVACFLLVDFVYYWEHRAGHVVNALWSAYHSVHHSADHFDQTVALRVSFVDFFVTPLFYLPLVLVGFPPLLVLACFGLVLAWQQWIHTETVGKLPWLDGWLNTPSNHRVHHGRNAAYLDRNMGGVLIIWDRLFGTYARETEKVEFGLVKPLGTTSPFAVHFRLFGAMLFRLSRARSVGEAFTVLLSKPGAHESP